MVKKMGKTNKEIYYEYGFSKENLYEKLNNKSGCYSNYGNAGDYLIEIKNDDSFFLGIERGGHSGYWYIARISEMQDKVIIKGKIIFDPDEQGNKKPSQKGETFGIIILFFFLWPLLLLGLFYKLMYYLYCIIFKKPKPKNRMDKLGDFMINYLGCTKLG
jgi:hypothetical protein